MAENPKITVHRFADSDTSIFDPSPFTTKLECLLRMTKTPYSVAKVYSVSSYAYTKGFTPHSPNGKIPYITVSGKTIGDSTLCYRYLKTHENIPDIDAQLTDEERAVCTSHRAWIEEWCYFLLIWERYIENPKATREGFFRGALPPKYRLFTKILFNRVRKYIKKTLYMQGVSRYSREEILAAIGEAVKSMSILVGENGFLDGRGRSANASLFGLFVTVYEGPTMSPNWHKELQKYPNLSTWMGKMIAEYFPERKLVENVSAAIPKKG